MWQFLVYDREIAKNALLSALYSLNTHQYLGTSAHHLDRDKMRFFAGLHVPRPQRDPVQPLRLSRKTACSPKRFQNHQGALKRSGAPHAFSATAFSIRAPMAVQSWRKSLIVQWWMFGVSYQL